LLVCLCDTLILQPPVSEYHRFDPVHSLCRFRKLLCLLLSSSTTLCTRSCTCSNPPPPFLPPLHAPPHLCHRVVVRRRGTRRPIHPPNSLSDAASPCLHLEPPAKPQRLTCRQHVKDYEALTVLWRLGWILASIWRRTADNPARMAGHHGRWRPVAADGRWRAAAACGRWATRLRPEPGVPRLAVSPSPPTTERTAGGVGRAR
jgi:hypothetical protein